MTEMKRVLFNSDRSREACRQRLERDQVPVSDEMLFGLLVDPRGLQVALNCGGQEITRDYN